MADDPGSNLVWIRSNTIFNISAMKACDIVHDLTIKSSYDELFDKGFIIEKLNSRMLITYQVLINFTLDRIN